MSDLDYRSLADRVVKLFRGESRYIRFKVWGRARSLDMTPILERLPHEGRLLDFGCGHGFFSFLVRLSHPELKIVARDKQSEKIEIAQRAAAASNGIDFAVGSTIDEPAGTIDAVTMLDVLHYIPFELWPQLFDDIRSCLKPGGVFLLKTHDPSMRGKYRFNSLFETVTTGWNQVGSRRDLTFRPREWYQEELGRRGFDVEVIRMDHGKPFSHVLYAARI